MSRRTDRWGLSILGPGDALAADGYKFSDADRRLIDRLLAYALEHHHHTGESPLDQTPSTGPNLTLLTAGGAIPSSARFHYRITIIDEDGNESGPSPVVHIDTPPAVAPPQAPALAAQAGTGSLQPGAYTYVLSAYKGATTLETKATNPAVVSVTGSNPSNQVVLTLPNLPPGADGFNIYRKSASGLHFLYLDSVAAPAPTTWTDDGSAVADCDRSLPAVNVTSNTNAITIDFPGTPPDDPFSWCIYRTADPSNWGRSLLARISPTGSPLETVLTYDDVGAGTSVGAPPSQAQLIGSPPKIQLTDAAEVEGQLPPGLLTSSHVVSFSQAGAVGIEEGTFTWVCDYELAEIVHCRAYLGRESTPTDTDVVIDINALRPAVGPAWESIFADPGDQPTVPVGSTIGATTVPSITRLVRGDALSVDIDQAGGGATPTDTDLTVHIFMFTKSGSETISQAWT